MKSVRWDERVGGFMRVGTFVAAVLVAVPVLGAAESEKAVGSASGSGEDKGSEAAKPVQLRLAGPVQTAGSDKASTVFDNTVLPTINKLLNVKLSERNPVNDSTLLLDPAKLTLKTESDVRVYFVGEGAGYHNVLGITVGTSSISSENARLIFPDASSSASSYDPRAGGRSASLPLLPGDFVNLGEMNKGSKLDFFLIANGAQAGKVYTKNDSLTLAKSAQVFSTDRSVNKDGINHVVAFATPNSPYLVLAFEDMWGGGDRDFNDVIIAVDIGARNVAALAGLTSTPEPPLLAILAAGVVVGLGFKWRAQHRSAH